MKSILSQLLLLSFLLFVAFSDNGNDYDYDYNKNDYDKTPSNNMGKYGYSVGEHGVSPEKPLPNENVHDSHEPNTEPNTDWKNYFKITKMLAETSFMVKALIVQASLLLCFLVVSRPCFIRIMSPTRYNEDGYPIKPWSAQNERIYDMSERRYLSNKDDAIPSDGDFDTDPEDLEVY